MPITAGPGERDSTIWRPLFSMARDIISISKLLAKAFSLFGVQWSVLQMSSHFIKSTPQSAYIFIIES